MFSAGDTDDDHSNKDEIICGLKDVKKQVAIHLNSQSAKLKLLTLDDMINNAAEILVKDSYNEVLLDSDYSPCVLTEKNACLTGRTSWVHKLFY